MEAQMINRSLDITDVTIERRPEGRTLICRALTYGRPYSVTDDGARFYTEVWRAGVFAKSIAQRGPRERIPLMTLHERRRLPIGAVLDVQDNAKDFIFRSKVSDTRDGDEALTLIEDGVLTGVSVGAHILANRAITGGVERVEAALHEISLAPASMSQFPDAGVLAVRAFMLPEDEPLLMPDVLTPSLDEARTRLAALTRP